MSTFATEAEAWAWIDEQRHVSRTGLDKGQTLATYVDTIGPRWARAIDFTSTIDPYSAGLRLRVLPALGHLPVSMLTAGLIDRAIDRWQEDYGASTVKNTVAGLVLVLDEAVRDGLIPRNPAKDRARRKAAGRGAAQLQDQTNPRDLALPNVATLDRLVAAVVDAGRHQCWGDVVMVLATTGLRVSEVAGLQVGDVDLAGGLIHVERQTYPGKGGLSTKATKGRRRRWVPIIDPLRPTVERLTQGRRPDARLITGPRGGVITTATLRDATGWDDLVRSLGLAGLVRHGLRHTALTWMADAGTDLYLLQRIAGHQDPAVTARYLHPDHEAIRAAGERFSAWWEQSGNMLTVPAASGNVVPLHARTAGPAFTGPAVAGRADRI
ncbi:tyrosine-type recombinase/integrase [Arsenicicoccus dermatophilus]|uniref:tyrosine-type recombinase/integrase n=1 Tax=Arsenicicoccus dermatophilus TaxID=1076331 RepID=UPI0039175030